jgi:hypothetical protein
MNDVVGNRVIVKPRKKQSIQQIVAFNKSVRSQPNRDHFGDLASLECNRSIPHTPTNRYFWILKQALQCGSELYVLAEVIRAEHAGVGIQFELTPSTVLARRI